MSRPRQPIELLEIKGKKHLTKAEIEQRLSTEVKANNDNIVAPAYLTVAQKKKFNEIANELIKIGIMSNLDCDCLGRYLVAETAYLKITDKLNSLSLDDIMTYEKTANLQDKYFKQCRSIASDLGLTISSRCKLVVPKADEKPKENKFAKFGVASG